MINLYRKARAYLLAVLFGAISWPFLLMLTGVGDVEFESGDWIPAIWGFSLLFAFYGLSLAPVAFAAMWIVRNRRWPRPLSDVFLWSAGVSCVLLFQRPGQWMEILDGALLGAIMGFCYWWFDRSSGENPP